MVFYTHIKVDRRMIRLKIEQISATKETEKFMIIAKNCSFVLQNNRPLLLGKGLKHRKPNWKVVGEGFNKPFILEQIIKAIETKLKEP